MLLGSFSGNRKREGEAMREYRRTNTYIRHEGNIIRRRSTASASAGFASRYQRLGHGVFYLRKYKTKQDED